MGIFFFTHLRCITFFFDFFLYKSAVLIILVIFLVILWSVQFNRFVRSFSDKLSFYGFSFWLFCRSMYLMAECTMMGSIWIVILIWHYVNIFECHSGHGKHVIETTTVVMAWENLFQCYYSGYGQCNLTDD